MAWADEFDGFLIGLDGVVWIGREPVPGAPEALRALLEAGKRIVFVTNNPGRPPAAYAERLRGMGVEVGKERIVTAGIVTARLAAEAAGPDGSAFVIGAAALKEMVTAAGATLLEGESGREASVVVVSGHRGFDYEELLTANLARDRAAARGAPGPDPPIPSPAGKGPAPGPAPAPPEPPP